MNDNKENRYTEEAGDKFAEALGDKLRALSEEPPVGMFDRIEQTLNTTSGVSRGAVVPLWRRSLVRGAAAAMVAAVFALVMVVTLRDNAPEEVAVLAEQVAHSNELTEEVVAQSITPEPERLAKSVAKAPKIIYAPVAQEVVVEENEEVEETAITESVQTPSEEKTPTTKRERRRGNRKRSVRQNQQELEDYWREAMAANEGESGGSFPVEVELYAANFGFNNGNVERNNVANSPMFVKEQNATAEGSSYFSPSLVKSDSASNLEHFMPITAGVTVSLMVSDWLSVDSGLLYTNVYSRSDTSGALSHYERRRTLDYLGVPLALSVYFANFNNLSLYGRVGCTAELCINAKDKTYMDGGLVQKYTLDVPAFTLSLDAAVGATYSLWNGVGLFGEVGCAYWNAPMGYVENYRTVNPLSLSSRVGLRFTFN